MRSDLYHSERITAMIDRALAARNRCKFGIDLKVRLLFG
jgi:hypothetical protein